MITLNLKEIFERDELFEGSYTLPPGELSIPKESGEIKEPLNVRVRISKDKKGYIFNLSIEGSLELECSRCLMVFRKDLSQKSSKHIEYYPSEGHIALSPEDLDVSFMEEPDLINLEEVVREEILLSIPMKPLCRPDCSGVHHHSFIFEEQNSPPKDPRFAILKDLLAK